MGWMLAAADPHHLSFDVLAAVILGLGGIGVSLLPLGVRVKHGVGALCFLGIALIVEWDYVANHRWFTGIASAALVLLAYVLLEKRWEGQTDPWRVVRYEASGRWTHLDWVNEYGHFLRVRPERQGAEIAGARCVITGPDGKRVIAESHLARALKAREEVEFQYPEEFSGDLGPLDMSYHFQWLVRAGGSPGAIEVATGNLVLHQ